MARAYKQKSIVSGLSIDDILNMDIDEFNKLNLSDLRKITGRLVSAANKRLRRFAASGIFTPATRAVERSGGSFSTKNKPLNALRSEFARAKTFLSAKTSTRQRYEKTANTFLEKMNVYGIDINKKAREFAANVLKSMGKTREDITTAEYRKLLKRGREFIIDKMWRAYEQIKDMSPDVANRGLKYTVLKEIVSNIEDDPNISVESISNKVLEQLNRLYEQEMEKLNEYNGVSDFFEF